MVKDYGYAGVFLGKRKKDIRPQEFVPCQCIFCFHDEALDAELRLNVLSMDSNRTQIERHLNVHLDHHDGQEIYCPASLKGGATTPLCTYNLPMTKEEPEASARPKAGLSRVKRKIGRFGKEKASVEAKPRGLQHPQDDAAEDTAGRKALQQLSSNKKLKSTASVQSSEELDHTDDIVDDSAIDPALVSSIGTWMFQQHQHCCYDRGGTSTSFGAHVMVSFTTMSFRWEVQHLVHEQRCYVLLHWADRFGGNSYCFTGRISFRA